MPEELFVGETEETRSIELDEKFPISYRQEKGTLVSTTKFPFGTITTIVDENTSQCSNFSIATEHGELDILAAVPQIYTPRLDFLGTGSCTIKGERRRISFPPINSKAALAGSLHEIEHAKRFAQLPEEELEKIQRAFESRMNDQLSLEQKGVIIAEEEYAWEPVSQRIGEIEKTLQVKIIDDPEQLNKHIQDSINTYRNSKTK